MTLIDHIRPKAVPTEADMLQLRHGAPKALALVRADIARANRKRRRRLWRLHDELVHRILRARAAMQDDCLA
jgi:hypothetical protein